MSTVLPFFQFQTLLAAARGGCWWLLLFALAGWRGLAVADDSLPVLRTAQEVRQLTAEEAKRQYPVRLEGVLTFYDERTPGKSFRFLQDDTAGIYIYPPANVAGAAVGQRAEVEGHTGPGAFAPVVNVDRLRVVGPGVFPDAKAVSFEQLTSGREDSQFVEVRGVVRSVRLEEERLYFLIEVATGEGRVIVRVGELPVSREEELIDCTVRVRGVCFTQFNRQRQLFNFGLLVPRPEDLIVEKPAPADPFAEPPQPISSLLQYSAQGSYGHRLKAVGAVTLRYGDRLYIQDEQQGLCVQTTESTRVAVGDRVEVLGFPARGEYTPMMESAVYRTVQPGRDVKPEKVTVDQALKGDYDCRLVTVEATLLDRVEHSQEPFLALQSGGFVFHAYLHESDTNQGFGHLQTGSKLAVTGVCVVETVEDWHYGDDWRAASFRLVMRSPADIVVLQAPPWWTLRKLLWTVGLLLGLVVVALAWVGFLRQRVRQQTKIIAEKLQAEALLKERFFDLLENANDVVFTHDLTGRLTSINSTGEQLLQRTRDQLLAANLLDLVAPEQRAAAAEWLEQVLHGVKVPATEWDFVCPSGPRVKLEINSRMIVQNGRQIEVESIGRDITERKRLEKEILEISNKEQQRIGHDLHDGVCQQLAAISYRIHGLARRLQDKAPPESTEAEHISDLISESLNQTRGVARGLFPVRLEENGLVSALEELAAVTGNRFKINCTFEADKILPAMDNSVALHVYYIAQEAVLNAARHSQARKIGIRLARQNDRLILTVKDDGSGFQRTETRRSGMGIAVMGYRARVIGANLDLKTTPGHGTELICGFQPSAPKPSEIS
jgi:PAS domain S-box-containing protein